MKFRFRWLCSILVLTFIFLSFKFYSGPIASHSITWLTDAASPWPMAWNGIRVQGFNRYEFAAFRVDAGRGELKAQTAIAQIGASVSPPALEISVIFDRPSVTLKDPALAYQFESGRLHVRLQRGERHLQFSDWESPVLRFDAEGRYDSSGKISEFSVRGTALTSFLAEWFSQWKSFEAEEEKLIAFEISYRDGDFQIDLDNKPFFKASWNMLK